MITEKEVRSKYFRYGAYSSLFVAVVFGFVAISAYLSSRWFVRIDMTEGKEYSITKATKNTIKNLDDIVNVKVFFSKKLPSQLLPTVNRIKDMLNEYKAESNGNLRIQYLDPGSDSKIEQEARGFGLQPVRMDAIEKDQRQIITGYLGIVLQYAGRKELLPIVTDVQNLEYNLTRAIKKLVRDKELKIGILKDFESLSFDTLCKTVKNELTKQYKLVDIRLKTGIPIDTTLKALIIPGPNNLSKRAKYEIDQYVMHGGKLIALIDGVTIQSKYGLNANTRKHNMNDLLGHYGVKIGENIVLDASCAMASFQTSVGSGFNSFFTTPYAFWPKLLKRYLNQGNPAVNRLAGIIFPWASSVEITADSSDTSKHVTATVLARTTKNSWTMQGRYNLSPQRKLNTPTGIKKSHVMAVVLYGKFSSFFKGENIPKYKKKIELENGKSKVVDTLNAGDLARKTITESPKTRILVVGNSRFATDQFIRQSNGINLNFMLNIVDWMVQDEGLITIRSRRIVDRPLVTTSPAKRSIIKWVNLIIMPVIMVLFGLFRMIIRRRKQNLVFTGGKR